MASKAIEYKSMVQMEDTIYIGVATVGQKQVREGGILQGYIEGGALI